MDIPRKKEYSLPLFGKTLSFIVSDLAQQANAAVIGQYGGTSVLATAVMGQEDRDIDFFPLTVDYEERFYAAGKIIGSRFIRREGRPSEPAILSGRLIDRSIRPLFDARLRRDVQIVITVLSYDEESDPDFVALMASSLALSISDIPWGGPIAGVRTLFFNGALSFNPTNKELEEGIKEPGSFDAFFSGTSGRINMIELSGKESREDDVKKSFTEAHEEIKKIIVFQEKIQKEIGKEKVAIALKDHDPVLRATVKEILAGKLETAVFEETDKKEKSNRKEELKKELFATLAEKGYEDGAAIGAIWEDEVNELVHRFALEKEKRPDGRKMDEVRELYAEVGLFPRLHGSAVFFRGQTQSLAVTTLAAPGSEQLMETMEASTKRRFMLHYNFPPYSVGETGRLGSPGRREIGHGSLAEKSLRGVIPSQDEFPYTIRLVSEVLSSNGSSSMASVCAGSLSLMDAGVPISRPVAGIAIGLMTHQGYDTKNHSEDFKILTDIQGPEDHYGDMDLKVAGTDNGITAVQMDVKIEGVNEKIFAQGLAQAQKAREEILEVIKKTLPTPRPQLSPYAPIIRIVNIKPYQIGSVIGPGGKVINGMIEKFGLQTIDIDESGKVFIAADSASKADEAMRFVQSLTKEFAAGDIVEGKIIKLLDFGGILDLGAGRDGMIHISEVKDGFVEKINDVLKVGQEVRAKVIRIDENGKIGLSMKALARDEGKNRS